MKLLSLLLPLIAVPALAQLPANVSRIEGEKLSAQFNHMGRLAVIETLGPCLITIPEIPGSSTGSTYEMESWDISDPSNPVVMAQLGKTTNPFLAHGATKTGNQIFVGGYPDSAIVYGGGPCSNVFRAPWTGPAGHWGPAGMMRPWAAKHWWSYSDTSGDAFLQLTNKPELGTTTWNHLALTGVLGFPKPFGDILIYASDQSNTGVAAYDVSDPTNPRLLDVLQDRFTVDGLDTGIGGYWAELYGHYVVFASRKQSNINKRASIQIVDFSDPENLRLHCKIDWPANQGTYFSSDGSTDQFSALDPMYVAFQDEFAFVDHMKVNIKTCETALAFEAPQNHSDFSQYARPLGNVLAAGGYNWWVTANVNEQGLSMWTHQATPDTRPPVVEYHIPEAGRTNYPVKLPLSAFIPETVNTSTIVPNVKGLFLRKASDRSLVPFTYVMSHTGVLTFTPSSDLQLLTTYEVEFNGVQDYMGNSMAPYSYKFTTGNTPSTRGVSVFGDPAAPTDPIAPTGPVAPTDPVEPTDPVAPTDPVEPTDPVAPTDPVEPAPDAPVLVTYVPNKSSQLACLDDGRVWALNADNDSIAVIDSAKKVVLAEVLSGHRKPTSVTPVAGALMAVTHADSDQVTFYQAGGTHSVAGSVATGFGSQPMSAVASSSGAVLYVALYGSGEILKIDVATQTILGRAYVGPTPKAMALTGNDSRLLVTRFISSSTEGQIYDVDTGSMSLSRVISVKEVNNPDDIVNGSGIPNYLTDIMITADGSRAYVTANKMNIKRGMWRNGKNLDDDNTIRAMMAVIDLVNNRDLVDSHVDFDNMEGPSSVLVAPQGQNVFVAMQGMNQVAFMSKALGVISSFEVGLAPQAMCFAPNKTLFVNNFMSRSVTALDLSDFLANGAINPPTVHINTVRSEKLPAQVLLGKQIFYNSDDPRMSPEGYISCASCHFDGGHDGQTWDLTGFGEGLRNTPSLKGQSGTRFGNAHWSANFDEIQDFEHQIRNMNKGSGFLTDEQFAVLGDQLGAKKAGASKELDALAAYVNSLDASHIPLSPYRAEGRASPQIRRGRDVFVAQGCGSCHVGATGADGKLHDVGTIKASSGQRLGAPLKGIRTPRLTGLFESAPYFHDGSAASLYDVLSTGTHNKKSAMKARDLDSLIAYLMQLDRVDATAGQ